MKRKCHTHNGLIASLSKKGGWSLIYQGSKHYSRCISFIGNYRLTPSKGKLILRLFGAKSFMVEADSINLESVGDSVKLICE